MCAIYMCARFFFFFFFGFKRRKNIIQKEKNKIVYTQKHQHIHVVGALRVSTYNFILFFIFSMREKKEESEKSFHVTFLYNVLR